MFRQFHYKKFPKNFSTRKIDINFCIYMYLDNILFYLINI